MVVIQTSWPMKVYFRRKTRSTRLIIIYLVVDSILSVKTNVITIGDYTMLKKQATKNRCAKRQF